LVDDVTSRETRQVCWRLSGRVQGVGFRWFVRQAAVRLGVNGDVANLADGRVEIRAQGRSDQLAGLLAAARRGPPAARVDRVETLALDEAMAFDGFDIRPHG
jgi:acylphosphatase